MTMQTVYDVDGNAFDVEPVDAREYLESGNYFEKPPRRARAAEAVEDASEGDADAEESAKPSDGLTVPELKEALAEKGIDIPEHAKKADLRALLDAAE